MKKTSPCFPAIRNPCSTHPAQYKSSRVFICADSEDGGFFMTDAVCGGSYRLLYFHPSALSVLAHTWETGCFFWHRLWTSVLFEVSRFCTTFQSWLALLSYKSYGPFVLSLIYYSLYWCAVKLIKTQSSFHFRNKPSLIWIWVTILF